MGTLIALANKKNNRWSTTDFLPLVLWMILGVFIGVTFDLLLNNVFGPDVATFPDVIGGIALVISGSGIYWYRTRTSQ